MAQLLLLAGNGEGRVYPYLRPMSAEAAPVDNWRIMNILRAWLQLRPQKRADSEK